MTIRNRFYVRFTGLVLILLLVPAMLLVPITLAQDAEATEEATVEAEATPEADVADTDTDTADADTVSTGGNNSYCALCHGQPWRTTTLADGSVVSLYVNEDALLNSVHGEGSADGAMGCIDCHGEDAFPHSGLPPADGRAYTLDAVNLCRDCHEEQAADLADGLHQAAIADGNTGAAVCTDCHGAHEVMTIGSHPELRAESCGDCHDTTLVEWQASPHDDLGPLGCATCHYSHGQQLLVGTNTTELCINCHNEGIEDIFVHAQHLGDNLDVGCEDCHMYPDPDITRQFINLTEGMMPTGHTMDMDTTPCNTCHEEREIGVSVASATDAESTAEAPDEVDEADEADDVATPIDDDVNDDIEGLATDPPESLEDDQQIDFVQLIQGFILGLGIALTLMVIFSRRRNPDTE